MGRQVGQKLAQKIGYPLWMAPYLLATLDLTTYAWQVSLVNKVPIFKLDDVPS